MKQYRNNEYWKCLVISPGSEISLGMEVIISVLATCNTEYNNMTSSVAIKCIWYNVSRNKLALWANYHSKSLDIKGQMWTVIVPRGRTPVTLVILWHYSCVTSRLTFGFMPLLDKRLLQQGPIRVKDRAAYLTAKQVKVIIFPSASAAPGWLTNVNKITRYTQTWYFVQRTQQVFERYDVMVTHPLILSVLQPHGVVSHTQQRDDEVDQSKDAVEPQKVVPTRQKNSDSLSIIYSIWSSVFHGSGLWCHP